MSAAEAALFGRTLVVHHRSGIGDLVWHLPYIRAIAARAEGGRVSVMARPSCRASDLLSGEACVEQVIEYDYRPRAGEARRGGHAGIAGMLGTIGRLRAQRFSHVFIFSSRVRYALMALAAGIPHRAGFGFGAFERALLSLPPFIRPHRGAGSWVYPEATDFAITHGLVSAPVVPRLAVPDTHLQAVSAELAGLPWPRVALALGTSEARKDWGEERFAQLAQALAARGFGVPLLGGAGERERAERVARAAGGDGRVRPLCQTSVLRSAAILKSCRLCVGNDTGVLNVAAAAEVPSLGLFGATRPLSHDPLMHAIQAQGMAAIAPDAVLAQVDRLLELHPGPEAGRATKVG